MQASGSNAGPGHRVEPRAVCLADDHRELRDRGRRHRADHLRAVADDALALDVLADHEAGDVGQEQQRDVEGVAGRDEPGGLVGGVDEEHSPLLLRLVGDDPDGPAVEARVPDHELLRPALLDLEERALVDQRVDQVDHVEGRLRVGRDDLRDHAPRGLGRRRRGRGLAPVARHVGEVALRGVDRVLVAGGEEVAAARAARVHLRAAHLLEGDLLADDHLGHPGRAQVHRSVAVAHDHDVAEGRDVGASGRAGAEQQAHLRDLARHLHLVVEDAPGAAAPGEHLHLVGDAGAGRVDEIDHRHPVPHRVLLDAEDLLDGLGAPRTRLHRRVVRHQGDGPPADCPHPGDDAVGAEPLLLPVGEEGVLGERAGVEQALDALADGQLLLLGDLLPVPLGPSLERRLESRADLGHRPSSGLRPALAMSASSPASSARSASARAPPRRPRSPRVSTRLLGLLVRVLVEAGPRDPRHERAGRAPRACRRDRIPGGPVLRDRRGQLRAQLLGVGQHVVAAAGEVGDDRLDVLAAPGALLDDPGGLRLGVGDRIGRVLPGLLPGVLGVGVGLGARLLRVGVGRVASPPSRRRPRARLIGLGVGRADRLGGLGLGLGADLLGGVLGLGEDRAGALPHPLELPLDGLGARLVAAAGLEPVGQARPELLDLLLVVAALRRGERRVADAVQAGLVNAHCSLYS